MSFRMNAEIVGLYEWRSRILRELVSQFDRCNVGNYVRMNAEVSKNTQTSHSVLKLSRMNAEISEDCTSVRPFDERWLPVCPDERWVSVRMNAESRSVRMNAEMF